MKRTPQGTHACRTGCKQIRLRRTDDAYRERTAVLLVIRVQNQDQVQCVHDLRRANVLLVRQREHHVQQVLAVPQMRVRIVEWETLRSAIGECSNRADLADQPSRRLVKRLRVLKGQKLLVIVGQIVQTGREDRHRRRVDRNLLELVPSTFVQQRMGGQQLAEVSQLVGGRHAAENQQPSHTHKTGYLRELLDRNSPITQDPLLAINERDLAFANARASQRRIERDVARSDRAIAECRWPAPLPCPSMMGSSNCRSPSVKIAFSAIAHLFY